MITTKTIEICNCDRCKKEISLDNRWKVRMRKMQIDRELDLCDECEYAFKAFMMNKEVINHVKAEDKAADGSKEEVKPTNTIVKTTITNLSDIDVKRTLSKKLVAFRKENKLTQQDVADMSGISVCAIGNIERGDTMILRSKTQEKLELFLNSFA